MDKEKIMKWTLIVGALFNFFAATVILFPDTIGAFSGLPASGSPFYNRMIAMFILVFGFIYGWLATNKEINRSIVGVAIIGKFGVFIVATLSFILGDIVFSAVMPAIIDLLFGFIFLWWFLSK